LKPDPFMPSQRQARPFLTRPRPRPENQNKTMGKKTETKLRTPIPGPGPGLDNNKRNPPIIFCNSSL